MSAKPQVDIIDAGLIDYKKAWDWQTELHQQLVRDKRKDDPPRPIHTLMLCQHPPVYTLGKSGSEDHIIWDEARREEEGVSYYRINRGGDITYHGPGQLVVYPIFDLDDFFTDVHKYVRLLEEAVIRTLKEFGINGTRIQGYTGVWIQDDRGKRKVCAIGVHLSRWVSMHGLAFNINTNLDHFQGIVPCGIAEDDKEVTSITKELNRTVEVSEVMPIMARHFQELFDFEIYERNATKE